MNHIETIIDKRLTNDPTLEIFNIEYEGKKLWIKKARKTGSNLLHHFVYLLTKNPILIPVENKNPKEALKFESSKLQELYDLSIPVPKVIQVSKEYFVLEDCGLTVNHLIKNNLVDNPTRIFENIITQLARLHNLGKFHGGSQIKNFTYKDEKIYFIDFEEGFNREIDIKELQFRDLFLFLVSLSKAKVEIDYKNLLYKYIDLTNNKDVIQKFHKLASNVNILIKMVENKAVWRILDRDTKSVYRLLKVFKDIPIQENPER